MKPWVRRIAISFIVFVVSFFLIINFVSIPLGAPAKEALNAEVLSYLVPSDLVFKQLEQKKSALDGKPRIYEKEKVRYWFERKNTGPDTYEFQTIAKHVKTNELLFNITYKVEKESRRYSDREPPKSKTAVVFVGCSFTYGAGVEFGETFTGFFEKKYPGVAFYNLGIVNGALNDHLYILQNGKHFLNAKKHEKVILVYYYISDHLMRETCSTRCLQDKYKSNLKKPFYDIKDNDSLVFSGFHADHWPKNALTTHIFSSKLLKDRDFPLLESEKTYRRHELLLKAFYDELAKTQNIAGAYHYWGWSNSVGQIDLMLPYVLKTNYKPVVLDIYSQTPKNNWGPYFVPYDGHPSALGHKANFISLDLTLRKDFPDLFKVR